MKSLARAVGLASIAVSGALLSAGGCVQLDPRFDGPASGPNRKGVSDGGASLDLCACTAGIGVGDQMSAESCATCFNTTQAFAPDPCYTVAQACLADDGCNAIRDCLSSCEYKPACLDECILPFDKDAAHEKYAAFLACACDVCEEKCQYTEPISCTNLEPGTGGGGGGTP